MRRAAYAVLVAITLTPAVPAQPVADPRVEAAMKEAYALRDKGDTAKAAAAFARAAAVTEQALGADHETVAALLYEQGYALYRLGQYRQAEAPFQRCLAIREKALGADHLGVTSALNNLGLVYRELGRHAEAEAALRRCLAVKEAKLGPDHLEVAVVLNNLGGLYQMEMGRYADAEPLYERSLAIKAKRLKPDDPSLATGLNNLAGLYRMTGRYAEAEPLYKRSLAIGVAKLGPDHLDVAATLNNLGVLYAEDMGRPAEAEPLYKRSLAIEEARLGPTHPEVANTLNNLAEVYRQTGRPAQAEPLFVRSLKIRESRLGANHPDFATGLNNLAQLFQQTGRPALAEPFFRRSLEVREARLGPDHPDTAKALNNLALLYSELGRAADAEKLYRRCLAIQEAKLGPDHPDTARTLVNLATREATDRRPAGAAPLFDRARRAARNIAVRTLPALSPERQAAFLAVSDRSAAALAASFALANAGVADIVALSAAWQVNGKANAFEASAAAARSGQAIDNAAVRRLAERLAAVRKQLAALTLAAPVPGREAERLKQLAGLARQESELAAALGRAGLVGLRADPWVTLDEVRAALPDGAVFIDIARFDINRFDGTGRQPPHYAAWLTPKAGAVRLIDLGPAAAIDAAVTAVRRAVEEAAGGNRTRSKTVEVKSVTRPKSITALGEASAEKQTRQSLDALAKLVLHPLLAAAGPTTEWVVSPDADLWLAPWAALTLPDGRYAVEALTIRLTVSGRDVVYAKQAVASEGSRSLIVADPDFDAGTGAERVAPALGRAAALPGTADEAKAVLPSLRKFAADEEPRVVTRVQATEAAVRRAARAKVLVLSTHGYFLPDQQVNAPESGGPDNSPVRTADGKPWQNPLLRCGLLFAGCNRVPSSVGDDGVLTGLEVVGLDLRGCELVALSACETGLGDVHSGEGVAGLRQAFQLAGARGVVATLWQVPDAESAQLMTAFFERLAAGKSKAEALRDAQVQVIASRRAASTAAHPYYWAAYTLTGQ